MKIILCILAALTTAILFSQTDNQKSIQELKYSIKNSEDNIQESYADINSFQSDEKKSVGLGIVYSLASARNGRTLC